MAGPSLPGPRHDAGGHLSGNILIGRKEHWTESLTSGDQVQAWSLANWGLVQDASLLRSHLLCGMEEGE